MEARGLPVAVLRRRGRPIYKYGQDIINCIETYHFLRSSQRWVRWGRVSSWEGGGEEGE